MTNVGEVLDKHRRETCSNLELEAQRDMSLSKVESVGFVSFLKWYSGMQKPRDSHSFSFT